MTEYNRKEWLAHIRFQSLMAVRGVPSFYKCWIAEAMNGGGSGYKDVGYLTCQKLPTFLGYLDNPERVDNSIAMLGELLKCDAGDDNIVEWFQKKLPRHFALIPKRRHRQFVDGVRNAQIEENCCYEY